MHALTYIETTTLYVILDNTNLLCDVRERYMSDALLA